VKKAIHDMDSVLAKTERFSRRSTSRVANSSRWVCILLCALPGNFLRLNVAAAGEQAPVPRPQLQVRDGGRETADVLWLSPNATRVANGDALRETRKLAGWTVHISRALIATNAAATVRALELLQAQLQEIVRVVPAEAVAELQKVPLYFSPEYPNTPPRAEFHPDAGWLRKHGRDPVMAKGVEFTNVRIFEAETRRMPNFALHELAHAYHNRCLPEGFDNPQIKAAYERAKASGKYDRVERQDSEGRKRLDRAYALTDPQEYFAEDTEAYFSRNDFYPYTRDELKQHDPEMFALLGKLWQVAPPSQRPKRGDSNVPVTVRDEAKAALRRPNILFILADDLGYGDVACYNSVSKIPTPNLDRLARESMRFTDAHSPATVCTPSRYSIMTGRMCFRTGYRGVFVGVGGPSLIEQGRLTLPEMLRGQGYATACVGKWHIGMTFLTKDGSPAYAVKVEAKNPGDWREGGPALERVRIVDFGKPILDSPVHRGFDYFFGTACCPTTDWLYAFIEGDRIPVPPTRQLDRTHLPKHPYANDNRRGLIAPNFDLESVDLTFLERSKAWLEKHVREKPDQPFFLYHAMQAVHLPSFPADAFKGKTTSGPHGDFIFEMDFVVGELMATLERLGVADNTLLIFSSDNGPETTTVIHMRADYGHDGARPWRGMKRDQWEGGHRVPLLVRWPGRIHPASVSDQTVCLTDVMATCAAITGFKLPADAAEDSVSFLPTLLGQDEDGPVRDYTLHETISLALAIRQGPWKYLDHRGSGGNNYTRGPLKAFALPETAPDAPAQLYNLSNDPGETNNLYFKRPDVVQKLKSLLETSKASGRSSPEQEALKESK
jgi:arylsulfatase A